MRWSPATSMEGGGAEDGLTPAPGVVQFLHLDVFGCFLKPSFLAFVLLPCSFPDTIHTQDKKKAVYSA